MSLELHRPASIDEAVAEAGRLGGNARFLAGGTDVVIQMSRGRIDVRHLIDISRLQELATILEEPDRFVIGALATHKAIERHPAFADVYLALPQAASVVGGHQVRNVATIGGNIVNASPAADLVPVLHALDASVALRGAAGTRSLPIGRFISGPGGTARAPDELLTHVEFARLPSQSATVFLKAGRRRAMEISVVCVAVALTLEADRATCKAVRLAVGAAAPAAFRATAAEQFLIGNTVTGEALDKAGRIAAEMAAPIDDVRASAEYRRLLVARMSAKALALCAERIGGTAR